jgi:Ribosomal RNA large subunit methyltransferase D, RlmJ
MANPHFGKLADVWKHAVLTEVIGREAPRRYAETHAGSAAYPMVHDGEREFGILRFLEVAPGSPVLARSRYLALVAPFLRGPGAVYPGSALLAMTALGDRCSYLFCDLDPDSAADLRRRAHGLRRCVVAESDGMAATGRWLEEGAGADRAIVHVDPFDPDARIPPGPSALDFAAQAAAAGTGLVYWYGYDQPADRGWAHRELTGRSRVPLWCGDMMAAHADGTGSPGDLGRATSAGTGCGVVLANVGAGTIRACEALGHALAGAYRGATLPGGGEGSLVFTTRGTPGAAAGQALE